jgi:hypothetical protein
MKAILKSIASIFKRRCNRIYILTRHNGSEKLFFQFRKDGEDCYSVNRAGAWYFDSHEHAREARDFLGLKNELNIESFERI